MKWMQWILLRIWSGHDSVHRRTDGLTDGQMDELTDKVEPVYPPFNFIEARDKIRRSHDCLVYKIWSPIHGWQSLYWDKAISLYWDKACLYIETRPSLYIETRLSLYIETMPAKSLYWDKAKSLYWDKAKSLYWDNAKSLYWDKVKSLHWDKAKSLYWDKARVSCKLGKWALWHNTAYSVSVKN